MKRENGAKTISGEITAAEFIDLEKDINLLIQEAEVILSRVTPRESKIKYITINNVKTKVKEK